MLFEKDELEQYFKDEIQRINQIELACIEKDIDEIREKAIEELESSVQQEAHMYYEQEFKELQSEHAVQLSKLHEETNRKLMKKRKELSESVFTQVKQQLESFVASDAYVDFLCDKVKRFAEYGYEDVILYLSKHDMMLKDQLQNAYGKACEIMQDEEIVLGGVRLECLKNGRIVDETFDTVLEEQKDWFYTNSGLFVK